MKVFKVKIYTSFKNISEYIYSIKNTFLKTSFKVKFFQVLVIITLIIFLYFQVLNITKLQYKLLHYIIFVHTDFTFSIFKSNIFIEIFKKYSVLKYCFI